jgi:hypothetical protein
MKRIAIFVTALVLLAVMASSVAAAPPSRFSSFVIPTISITSVDVDQSVTITTANFPAYTTFNVLMNTYGTLGVGGTKVASVDSGAGGALTFTFDIPSGLKGLQKIAIRLEATSGGYFSYNWFYNKTSSTTTPGTSTPTPSSSEVVPVFWIKSVAKDGSVTIETTSLSAGYTYDVYMNTYGTLGVGGTKVDTISSGTGGVKNFTFTIPADLHGLSRIAIRLASPTTGYYGYNWFWNSTSP